MSACGFRGVSTAAARAAASSRASTAADLKSRSACPPADRHGLYRKNPKIVMAIVEAEPGSPT
jgi:hypothetical protein